MSDAQIRGLDELMLKLQRLGPNAMRELGTALEQEAMQIVRVAKDRVPQRDGELKRSIKHHDAEISGDAVSVTISAGDNLSAPYALAIHEHLSEHSPPSWRHLSPAQIDWNIPGTGRKYLENPLNEAEPSLCGNLARRLDLRKVVR